MCRAKMESQDLVRGLLSYGNPHILQMVLRSQIYIVNWEHLLPKW